MDSDKATAAGLANRYCAVGWAGAATDAIASALAAARAAGEAAGRERVEELVEAAREVEELATADDRWREAAWDRLTAALAKVDAGLAPTAGDGAGTTLGGGHRAVTPEEHEIIERMELHVQIAWPGDDRMAAGLRLIRDLQARLAAAEETLSLVRDVVACRMPGGWHMSGVWSAREPFPTQEAAWRAWLDYHRRGKAAGLGANEGQGEDDSGR